MTELAALNIKITGDAGDLKTAIAAANGDLAKLVAGAKAAGLQVSSLAPKFNGASGAAGGMAHAMRGVSQQLSQVGQQTMATGNFVQSLAIQLPDLGLAFGAVGAAAGLFAGIALPLVIGAFMDTAENAGALAEAVTELTDATEAFRISAQAIRLGIDEREVAIVEALHVATIALNSELSRLNANRGSQARVDAARQELELLQRQLDAYRKARDEAEKLKSEIESAKDAMVAAGNAAATAQSIVSGLLGTTQSLAAAAWDYAGALGAAMGASGNNYQRVVENGGVDSIARAGNAATFGRAIPRVIGVGNPNYRGGNGGGGGGSGGGGGGAGRDFAGELEAFQETLMTETELEAAQFAERQTLLQEFLSAKVVSLQEYQAYEQEIKAAHEAKMAEIEATAQQQRLSQTAGMFGALASIAQAGGQRMAKAAAAFQAIEGTVNAYGAAIKALNTPGLTPAGRFAAYASVLAAGLKGVASIRQAGGIGGGSGGAAGGVAQAAGPSQAPLDVRLTGINANDLFSGAQLGSLLDRLSATAGDRGYRLMVAA